MLGLHTTNVSYRTAFHVLMLLPFVLCFLFPLYYLIFIWWSLKTFAHSFSSKTKPDIGNWNVSKICKFINGSNVEMTDCEFSFMFMSLYPDRLSVFPLYKELIYLNLIILLMLSLTALFSPMHWNHELNKAATVLIQNNFGPVNEKKVPVLFIGRLIHYKC